MTKPAYLVIAIDVRNEGTMHPYREGVVPLLARYNGEIVASTDKVEVLDGTWPRKQMTLIQFPSVKHAHAFRAAPEYTPLRQLREDTSEQDCILVEGLADEAPKASTNGAVYMLGTSDVTNPEAMGEYAQKVPAISAKYEMEALAASNAFEVLDGSWPRKQMVLLRFSSEDKFKAFWSDPDYVPLKELREASTEGEHVLFPAVVD